MILILCTFFFSPMSWSQTAAQKSQIILKEYGELRSFVATLTPDEVYAGLYKIKKMGDYEIVWNFGGILSRDEFIRIYHPKSVHVKPERYFAITYHRSSQIYPTRQVIRREWGFWPYEFRYDSVDTRSREYLGKMETEDIEVSVRDQEILDEYGIELFFD